jgi:hypothetical protein
MEKVRNPSNSEKSQKAMRVNIFAEQEKANPDTGSIRGLILVVVKLTSVQVIKLLL